MTVQQKVFRICQSAIPTWADLSFSDFDFDKPKGFSSFTMGVRSKKLVTPNAVLYRQLEGKENAILDFETEKEVFLMLGEKKIAAHCLYYDKQCRIETFYQGHSLEIEELFDRSNLRKIANQLYALHQLQPTNLPKKGFFELIQEKWVPLAKDVLYNHLDKFPINEREMCVELRELFSEATIDKVNNSLPKEPMTFCHNDTYHGNIYKLDSGEVKLLDFEFSCLNHKAYDFSNLFAETVMQHKVAEYPYFRINNPRFGDQEILLLINFYLDNMNFESKERRDEECTKLLSQVRETLKLSDYKYAMAAVTLSINPIQNIRFIPYAYQRFQKFLEA